MPFDIQTYDEVNKFFNTYNKIEFMNHGFFPSDKKLKQKDLLFKYEATLYLKLLENIKTKGLILLDIGCGRGGGLNILKEYLKLKKVYGCDINSAAIKYCRENYKDTSFKICSSEKLKYNDKSFDLITNVESFHCYENKRNFFKEAARVLKNNGYLLMADVNLDDILLDNSFKNFFKVVNVFDITPNVAFACIHNIENFSKNINNEEIKNWLVSLCQTKFDAYTRYDSFFIIHLKKR